jgi:hypothetical protein
MIDPLDDVSIDKLSPAFVIFAADNIANKICNPRINNTIVHALIIAPSKRTNS